MRALIVHPGMDFSVADVYRGWSKGLQQVGVEVVPFNLDDRLAFYSAAKLEVDGELRSAFSLDAAIRMTLVGLEAACYEVWPDIVVVISGFFLDDRVAALLRERGHKLVIVHTESPYEDDRQLEVARLADLNVLNDPTNIERFVEVAPSMYLGHCFDPDVHRRRPAAPEYVSEFCFVGTGYPSRVSFFEQVDWSGIDAAFGGNWLDLPASSPLVPLLTHDQGECCDNTETAARYASTLTSANLYRSEAQRPDLSEGWAIGPREVELAAIGTWFARQPRGEGDGLFPMLPTFSTPDELGDVLRWALAHPDEREDAALKAREAVSGRTFDRQAAELLSALGL